MRKRTRYQRGAMMLEVLIASFLTAMVLLLLISTQLQVLNNFQRAVNENTANRTTYNALRTIREQAQGAVMAQLFANGNEVRLFMPRRDTSGNLILPVQPDTANPIVLQVNLTTGTLTQTRSGTTVTLLTGLSATRPQGGGYVPFSVQQYAPGVQALHIRLSVQQGASRIWYEETILLRNTTEN